MILIGTVNSNFVVLTLILPVDFLVISEVVMSEIPSDPEDDRYLIL